MRALPTILLPILLATLAHPSLALAGKRDGFDKFQARYNGGYNLTGPEIQAGGASKVSIRSNRGGTAARVLWKNTFYDEAGRRSDVRTVWLLRPDGTFLARTIDPTRPGVSASGSYVLKNRRIVFDVGVGDSSVIGTIRLVGGGALTISLTLDSDTFEFHGGRR